MHKKSKYRVFVLLLIGLSTTAQDGVCAEFIRGADISIQTRQEASGVIYNEYGVPEDAVIILKNHDLNWIRIRIFHTPSGSPYGVCQDINYVTALAARVKAEGFKFLLDFHYSDTWADPGKQTKPAAWKSLTQPQLVTAVHDYTRDVIAHLRTHNAMPDMVQIGNEIICGMLWPNGNCCGMTGGSWANLVELINAGIAGVNDGRGSEPMPKIMLHIDRGGDWGDTQWFFDNILSRGVVFDVIGQSFYPQWHGTLDDLTNCLDNTAATYPHDIVIAEAGDYYTGSGKTPESQKAYLEEVIRRVQATPNGKGIGVFYWEPTWVWNESTVARRALFAPADSKNVDMLMGMEAFDKIYGDMTGDGIVNFEDLPGFFEFWLEDNAELDLDDNSVINFHEFSVLAQNWLE
jgi:arabinogalactan endo-1,4-beta-galactosidase